MKTAHSSRAAVTVTPRPIWRIRAAAELPRYLLQATALAGLVASARFAISPPRPVVERASTPSAALVDRAAEGFATLFARRYLTWDAGQPEAQARGLSHFLGSSSLEAEAGLRPPQWGEQRVQWAQVVQARQSGPGDRVYTVAAQTDTAGLLYLSVPVMRRTDGRLSLAGYPAFVGPPASAPAVVPDDLREVKDAALQTVATRALSNYLSGAGSQLAADLTDGAGVSLPSIALALVSLDGLDWSSDGRSVLAVVRAHDERGAEYTLGYELTVTTVGGRWEVSSIETDPSR